MRDHEYAIPIVTKAVSLLALSLPEWVLAIVAWLMAYFAFSETLLAAFCGASFALLFNTITGVRLALKRRRQIDLRRLFVEPLDKLTGYSLMVVVVWTALSTMNAPDSMRELFVGLVPSGVAAKEAMSALQNLAEAGSWVPPKIKEFLADKVGEDEKGS